MRTNRRSGQSTLELAIMLAVIVLAFVGLQNYVRNAAAGRLKSSADSISQTLFNAHNGTSNLTINRVTQDTVTAVAGNVGKTVSTTTVDNTVRTDTSF